MTRIIPSFQFESVYWANQQLVVGVDEVGRGCLAGPVVAGAVCFDPHHKMLDGIADSKQLSTKQRAFLEPQIRTNCQSFATGEATVGEINRLGILQATFLAMERALSALKKVEVILVDGNQTPKFKQFRSLCIQTIVKGDQLSYSIAAASILAKVHRDQVMEKLHAKFPSYDWVSNKGYGTVKHRKALFEFGMTKHHRKKFCETVMKKFVVSPAC